MPWFDHDRIRDEQDRSYTLRLLDVVLEPGGEVAGAAWADALESLRGLEDYRTVAPLRRFVEDGRHPAELRHEVSRTLAGFDLTSTSAERRGWWASQDEVLRAHAMRLMGRTEAEIVNAVATDATHPLQAIAVSALEWGFEESEFQDAKIAALDSPRADVRLAGVYAVSWDEPLAAEPKLRQLLTDSDSQVATAAAYALQYYPSLATLVCLRGYDAQMHGKDFAQQLAESIDFIEGTIEAELLRSNPPAQERLRDWIDAISYQPDESSTSQPRAPSETTKRSQSLKLEANPQPLDEILDTTTGPFLEKARALRAVDWESVPDRERADVARRLVEHPDPEVRIIATVPLARWNHGRALVELLDDEHAGVRKTAMYSLGQVEKDPQFAGVARARLTDAVGTGGVETLATFARHAEPLERDALLFDFAVASHQFGMRTAAVQLLSDVEAEVRLRRVLRLLDQPPWVNWAYHIALLETDVAREVANGRRLAQLADVDNIHVAALAARVIAGARSS